MTDTKIIEKLKIELEFVAKNPNSRGARTASEYAADLLAFIHAQHKIAHLKNISR